MRTRKRMAFVVSFGAAATLLGGAIAIAAGGPGMGVVSATFSGSGAVTAAPTQCTGSNGHTYDVLSQKVTGSQTSAASKLTGHFAITQKTLIDATTGALFSVGTYTLKNSNGKILVKGPVTVVGQENPDGSAATVRGFLNVPLYSLSTQKATQNRLIANIEAEVTLTGA